MLKLSTSSTFKKTLLMVTLSVASLHALAGPSNQVPFKADVTTSESLSFATPDNDAKRCIDNAALSDLPPLSGLTVGTGNASHLGKIAFVATDCVRHNGNVYSFDGGKLTVTAANGDQLFITYQGTFGAQTSPTIDVVERFSPFIISGGTGKFINATGSGFLSGSVTINPDPRPDAAPSPGKLHLEGTLAYPK